MHVLKHMHVHTYTNYTKVKCFNIHVFMLFPKKCRCPNPINLVSMWFLTGCLRGVVIPLIFSQSFLGILRVPQSPPLFQELEERFVLLCTRFQASRMIADNQWTKMSQVITIFRFSMSNKKTVVCWKTCTRCPGISCVRMLKTQLRHCDDD